YPFENEEIFKAKYPADFISEGIDQTRGWFYSLLAISTLLFDQPAFKNIIVLELILDKYGKKMSTSKGNAVNPFDIVHKYGADPLRWYMLSTSNPWVPTRFDEDALVEVVRKFFDTLKNSYSFFTLYANIDNIAKRAHRESKTIEGFLEQFAGDPERIDNWVTSRFNSLVKRVTGRLDDYDLTPAARMITDFVIDDLSNWYIRLNRRRFWAPADDPSKMRAYLTLYRILCAAARLVAPYVPFLSEYLWQELIKPTGKSKELSVHMTGFPVCDESAVDDELEETMALAQKVVSIGRAARSRKNLKVRQPLAGILVNIPGIGKFEKMQPEMQAIRDELNIKKVEQLSSVSDVVSLSAKLNFDKAGPLLGSATKEVSAKIARWSDFDIMQMQADGRIEVELADGAISLTAEEIEIQRIERDGFAVESDGWITVALRTDIDGDLRDEGFAREMVNKIQNMRKTSGFEVTDRITVMVSTADPLAAALRRHHEFIRRETLADRIDLVETIPADNMGKNWNINGVKADIAVKKQ
ncbi:MAG: class I tRNA ligase family protein, partial [Candidatus Zixiibacteriota bacterium]